MSGILCPAKTSESIFHSTGVMRAVRMATKWNSFYIRNDCHCLESHRRNPILPSIQTQRKKRATPLHLKRTKQRPYCSRIERLLEGLPHSCPMGDGL
ncbi:hypothetical protein CEXT_183741 [Caerostris extrusa]|uniref:Uncharacterized protein n=1 Tax=Caerostris extrusa TaxID=172846 RepID=A0AAV4MHF7_CAEEX|nr:hypothetical protein CEXT_183741 [Caerostris extrusa]